MWFSLLLALQPVKCVSPRKTLAGIPRDFLLFQVSVIEGWLWTACRSVLGENWLTWLQATAEKMQLPRRYAHLAMVLCHTTGETTSLLTGRELQQQEQKLLLLVKTGAYPLRGTFSPPGLRVAPFLSPAS